MLKKKGKKPLCINFSRRHLQRLLRAMEKKTAEYRKISEMLDDGWRN